MCGICGTLSFARPDLDPDVIERMTSALSHRGPDAHRTFGDEFVRLGHRRLAVVDPGEHADQPMSHAGGALWLVFNGEIYNHEEHRRRFEAAGRRFRTRSDAEVILHLYEEQGDACVESLRGMFAFALWDGRRRRMLLARDHHGQKPLYFHATDGSFVFASEIKALLQHPEVRRTIDPGAVHDFLSFDYVPGPGTVFSEISKLPPGHVMVVDEDGSRLHRYWQPSYRPGPEPLDLSEVTHELLERITESVRLRLMADVPLGVFLSGGIDSSALVALLRRIGDGPIHTFSLGFAEPEHDERPHAQEVAKAFGTVHREFACGPEVLRDLPAIVAHYDQPFSDPSILPTWELARRAREHVTVVLTGEGGDESFGGYDRYVRATASGGNGGVPDERFSRSLIRFDQTLKRELYTGDFWEEAGGRDSTERLAELYRRSDAADPLNALLDVDVRSYLTDDLLVKLDMTMMRHSLEGRCPYLDRDLFAFVSSLPGDWKVRDGTTKWIVRRALRDLLPSRTLTRAKLGFAPPMHRWLRGPLRELALDTLTDSRARSRGYFRPGAVQRLLDEHLSGRGEHGYRLWNLLVLELWHREVLDPATA